MKPEDKKCLKRFWLRKGLLLSSFIGSVGIAVITVPFLQSQYAMVQDTEVSEAMKAFPDSSLKVWDSTEPYAVLELARSRGDRDFPLLLDSDVRASEALKLGQSGDKRAVPLLLKLLNDSDDTYTLISAASVLGQLRDKRAVPLLLKLLNDSDSYYVRISAASVLGQLGDKTAVPFLVKVVRDKKSLFRFEAFRTLKKLSESGQIANSQFHPTASLFLILGGGLFLGAIFVGGMGLIFFLHTRNPYPLSWSGHILLPEETIAELIALKRRRQKQNLPQWKLLLELTVEVLLLLRAIHIQVRFQNLSLPPSKKRNID
jgi:HEAT repeats